MKPVEIDESCVCLDLDARNTLGISEDHPIDGYPTAVQANVATLFQSRLLFYAVALLALLLTVVGVFTQVTEFDEVTDWIVFLGVGVAVFAILAVVVVFDLRARLQY